MWWQRLQIVLLGTGAAVLYGVVHDQVTVRICLEYFTRAHPAIFPTSSPVLGLDAPGWYWTHLWC